MEPKKGVVQHVAGRASGDGSRGLPKLTEMDIEEVNGSVKQFRLVPPADPSTLTEARAVAAIGAYHFDKCPVCLIRAADSREHVPSAKLGGRVMTSTCTRCNNELGSRIEAGLQDWYDGVVDLRLVSDKRPEPIARYKALVLRDEDGVGLIMPQPGEGPTEEAFGALGKGETFSMRVGVPGPATYMNGVLKSAYLAACVALERVPEVGTANEIREELLRIVAVTDRREIVLGPHASRIGVARTGKAATADGLQLLRADTPELGVTWYISLAGTLVVQWPFPDIDPGIELEIPEN